MPGWCSGCGWVCIFVFALFAHTPSPLSLSLFYHSSSSSSLCLPVHCTHCTATLYPTPSLPTLLLFLTTTTTCTLPVQVQFCHLFPLPVTPCTRARCLPRTHTLHTLLHAYLTLLLPFTTAARTPSLLPCCLFGSLFPFIHLYLPPHTLPTCMPGTGKVQGG